jgi:hypothetical protein
MARLVNALLQGRLRLLSGGAAFFVRRWSDLSAG